MLLRGGTAVVPTILTLHSGAALANSSNLIAAAQGAASDGNYYCLNEGQYSDPAAYKLDVGDRTELVGSRIDGAQEYFDSAGNAVTDKTLMCAEGGNFSRTVGGELKPVPKGALVSATALLSFTARGTVNFTEI